jgi:hypothetical protein
MGRMQNCFLASLSWPAADEQDPRKPRWGSRVPLMTPSYPLRGGMPGQMDWAGMKTRLWRWLAVLPRNIWIASQHRPTELGYPGKFFDFDRKIQQMTRVPGPAGLSFSINRRLMDVLQMSHNLSLGEEQQQAYDFNIGTGTPVCFSVFFERHLCFCSWLLSADRVAWLPE